MGLRRFNLLNIIGNLINPATEDKQDDIITELESLDGKDFATETTLDSIDSKVSTEAKQDDVISNQTDGSQKTQLVDSSSNNINAQNPLPTNGDSVYAKDINVSGSNIGTFTGAITDLVDDIESTISSAGHSSPAWFEIKTKRPINNSGIKLCSPSGDSFSNVKIILKDAAGTVLDTIDDSSSGVAYSSFEYYWKFITWCTIRIEFHTTNDIDLNWALIEKSTLVHSAEKHQDSDNSTLTPLGSGGVFTGEWVRTVDYSQAIVTVVTDEDAATDGLRIEVSDDGVNVRHAHVFSPLTNTPNGHHYPSTLDMTYMRVIYTNGSSAQSIFTLLTTLFVVPAEEGHVHGLEFVLESDHPASIVRAIQTGRKPNGEYTNGQYTAAGNPKVAIEEMETEVSEQINKYPVGTGSNGSVTLTDANTAYAIPTAAPAGSYVMNINSLDDVSIFVGYEDSNANGMEFMAGDPPARISLGADQQIYVYCASAGKVVSYTLKEIN